MLTVPRIVEWGPQNFVGVRRRVTIPFGGAVDEAMGAMWSLVGRLGARPVGPPLFRYTFINMPELIVEFAVPVETGLSPLDGDDVAGTLPQGRYALLTYWGGYDKIIDATAMLMGWADLHHIEWDVRRTPEGDWFASRFESYVTDPREEPDPEKLRTDIYIRLKD